MYRLLIIFCLLFVPSVGATKESDLPKFASLKHEITNIRAGPGTQYPILWIFKRRHWPVKLIAEYNNWYKIRDMEGEEGWIYGNLVRNQHTVVVSPGAPATLYRNADATRPLLRFGEDVVMNLLRCSPYICEVSYQKTRGWIVRSRLKMVQ